MIDYGFKISQDGFDVKTCEDKDLVMSSKFNMLKTAATGTIVTAGDLAHNLSYVPLFFSIAPTGVSGKSGFIGDDTAYADSTNIHTWTNNTRYYIFYQQF